MIIISYTNGIYYEHLEDMLHACCKRFGIKHVHYDQQWFMKTEYYQKHKDVADLPRLAGYCIWKPYIIADAFQYDDLVVYCDASVVFEIDPHTFCSSVKNMACGATGFINAHWTKRDTFVHMGCDVPECWNMHQLWAGIIVVRQHVFPHIKEMSYWCENLNIVSDVPNECGLPNLPGFQDHRHDQSIITNMRYLYPNVIEALVTPFHDYDC